MARPSSPPPMFDVNADERRECPAREPLDGDARRARRRARRPSSAAPFAAIAPQPRQQTVRRLCQLRPRRRRRHRSRSARERPPLARRCQERWRSADRHRLPRAAPAKAPPIEADAHRAATMRDARRSRSAISAHAVSIGARLPENRDGAGLRDGPPGVAQQRTRERMTRSRSQPAQGLRGPEGMQQFGGLLLIVFVGRRRQACALEVSARSNGSNGSDDNGRDGAGTRLAWPRSACGRSPATARRPAPR